MVRPSLILKGAYMSGILSIFTGAVSAITGGISSLVATAFQLIIELIASLLVQLFSGICSLYITAMASINSDIITTWLGDAASADMQNTIRGIALALCGFFAAWEIVKYFYCYISGEQPQTKPTTILVRLLVFGTLSITGITISTKLFDSGIDMFKSLKDVTFGKETYGWVGGNVSGNFLLNSIVTDASSGNFTGMLVDVSTELYSSLVNTVIGAALIILAFINLFKFLMNMFEKFAAMIVYVYMSPIALSCGVSSSWRGVASAWFKNFISQIVMWCIDVWVLFGGLNLLATGIGTIGSTYVLWAALCAGYMKIALHLDDVLKSVGLSVTKTSGNMLDDVLGVAGGVVAGVGAVMTGGTSAGLQTALSGAKAAMSAAKTAGGVGNIAKAGLGSVSNIAKGIASDTAHNAGAFLGKWQNRARNPGFAISEFPSKIQTMQNNSLNKIEEDRAKEAAAKTERNKETAADQLLLADKNLAGMSRDSNKFAKNQAYNGYNNAIKRGEAVGINDNLTTKFNKPTQCNAINQKCMSSAIANPSITNAKPVTLKNQNGESINGYMMTMEGEKDGQKFAQNVFATQSQDALRDFYTDNTEQIAHTSMTIDDGTEDGKQLDFSVVACDNLTNLSNDYVAGEADQGITYTEEENGAVGYMTKGNETMMVTKGNNGEFYGTKGTIDSSGQFIQNKGAAPESLNSGTPVKQETTVSQFIQAKATNNMNAIARSTDNKPKANFKSGGGKTRGGGTGRNH